MGCLVSCFRISLVRPFSLCRWCLFFLVIFIFIILALVFVFVLFMLLIV